MHIAYFSNNFHANNYYLLTLNALLCNYLYIKRGRIKYNNVNVIEIHKCNFCRFEIIDVGTASIILLSNCNFHRTLILLLYRSTITRPTDMYNTSLNVIGIDILVTKRAVHGGGGSVK